MITKLCRTPFAILILSAHFFFPVTLSSATDKASAGTVIHQVNFAQSELLEPYIGSTFFNNFMETLLPAPSASEMALKQAVLIESLDGRTIDGIPNIVQQENADLQFHPASTIKLATALFALRRLGPDYTFSTSLATTGSINNANGVLNGDLFVSGNDPAFRFEHAVALAQALNQLGIRKVSGNIVVAPGFTINTEGSSSLSARVLKGTLNKQTRSCLANEAFRITSNGGTASAFSLAVLGKPLVGSAPAFARVLAVQQSPTLREILKVLLCYSDNFMADHLGALLGGPRALQKFLVQNNAVPTKSLYVNSNSGLGSDSITARSMMLVLRALRDELSRHNLTLTDLLPVAGVDPGTLNKRFSELRRQATVVGKTGTHIHNQGGISALVGETQTAGGAFLFVIFNRHGNVPAFRARQDLFIKGLQDRLGGAKAWPYQAQKLAVAMRVQCAR